MPERFYSERLGRISDRRLQAALDRFGLGRLVGAEPIPQGHFGQNLFVTADSGAYVLRGNPHYRGQYPAERFYAGLLAGGTRTPVPWPYRVDMSTGIFGWEYAVMPRMPGLQLSDHRVRDGLDRAARRAVARALGGALAEMHTLTWDHPGRYHPGADRVVPLEPPDASVWALPPPRRDGPAAGAPYGRWVAGRVRARLATALGHGPATVPADLDWAGSVLAGAAGALSVPFGPCLVMEDYKEGNLVVTRTGTGGWAVSGVFDLAQAYFGDGETDVPRTLCSYLDADDADGTGDAGGGADDGGGAAAAGASGGLAAAFLGSYLAARPPRPGFAERAAAYLLLDRALLWEFFQRRGLRWWPESWTFRDWAGRYLDLMAPVLAAAPSRPGQPG